MGLFNRNKTVQGTSDGPQVPVRRKVIRVTARKGSETFQHDLGVPVEQANQVNVVWEMTNTYGRDVTVLNTQIIGEENA